MKRFIAIVGIIITFLSQQGFSQQGEALSLKECIRIALARNSQLKNAERRVNLAGAGVTSAWSGVLPSLSSNFSSTRIFQADQGPYLMDVPAGFDTATGRIIYKQMEIIQESYYRNTHSAGLSLHQLIYDGGQWWNCIKQANASYRAAEHSLQATRQSVILNVMQKYFQLLKAMRLQQVYEEAVRSSQEQLKKAQSMFEIGSVAQIDVYKAKVNLGNNQINLIKQKNLVAVAKADLNVALGRDPDAPIKIMEDNIEIKPMEITLDQAIAKAMENNPELKRLQEEVKSASYALKVAKGDYLPKISASVGYSRYNTIFDRVYGGFDKNYSVRFSLQVSFDLFNGFRTQANVEQGSINYQIAKESLIEKKRNLKLEVKKAFLDFEAFKRIMEINKENVISAEEDLRLARERYRVGAGTMLEVIDAQVALTRARSQLISAKYDALIAQAQLKAAMGILEEEK